MSGPVASFSGKSSRLFRSANGQKRFCGLALLAEHGQPFCKGCRDLINWDRIWSARMSQ